MGIFTVIKAAAHVTKMAAVETNEMAEKALQARRLRDLMPKSNKRRKVSIEVIDYDGIRHNEPYRRLPDLEDV